MAPATGGGVLPLCLPLDNDIHSPRGREESGGDGVQGTEMGREAADVQEGVCQLYRHRYLPFEYQLGGNGSSSDAVKYCIFYSLYIILQIFDIF